MKPRVRQKTVDAIAEKLEDLQGKHVELKGGKRQETTEQIVEVALKQADINAKANDQIKE